jgi:hypothetical protein
MSIDFVTKQISGMSTAKATGLDGISVKLLKLTSDENFCLNYVQYYRKSH